MVTTHGGSGGKQPRATTRSAKTAGVVEHYCCSLAGLLVTIGVCLLLYPELVVATLPFAMLSTTSLVFLLFGTWAASWLAFELIWEWASGRHAARD